MFFLERRIGLIIRDDPAAVGEYIGDYIAKRWVLSLTGEAPNRPLTRTLGPR
jgi:hypothetical protein